MPEPSAPKPQVPEPEPAPVEEVLPPQPLQEITITGDYQKENVSYYEEELERKFGGAEKNTAAVERNFYDVNVKEEGSVVKENDVVLIYKEMYGDEEPLLPPVTPKNTLSEGATDASAEAEGTVMPEEENEGASGDASGIVISADMIFANAGIDPFVHGFVKKEPATAPEVGQENLAGADAFYQTEEEGTVFASAPQTEPDTVPSPLDEPGQAVASAYSNEPQQSAFFTPSGQMEQEAGFPPADRTAQGEIPDFWPDMSVEGDGGNLFGMPSAGYAAQTQAMAGAQTAQTERIVAAGAARGSLPQPGQAGANAPSQPKTAQSASGAENIMPPILPVSEKKYEFPPIDLLAKPVQGKGANERELKETAAKLQNTLQSFGVRVTITNISCGPAVTQYELQPEQGVKVNQITKLSDDIKLNLAATDIRIEAPIPGKAAIGIEVPNKENTPVILRELLESTEFKNHKSRLAFAVGKNISGQIVVSDIAKMPHMLIAGATGSGKSVCINTIIMSILYKADPKDVKLIMVDPKVVELSVYNGIPHLLIPVVTDPKKASAALNWAVAEMTDRYQKFAALAVRDLNGYNEKGAAFDEPNPAFPRLPQIVIIVDELADLMMVASANEVEDAICRLAQMARAAGLHLIIATQRPSVNVITGVIKANVPSRVAFAVTSAVDSRTILDGVGAERLLGKGDMLFFPSGYPKPVRIQGAFVSDAEVSAVVDFLKEQAEGTSGYNEEINQRIMTATGGGDGAGSSGSDGNDDYFAEAGKFIIEKQKASIGMLQRVYKIGFNRAARIMDQLTAAGVVGPEEGTKPRKILMTLAEFEEYLGS
ncbi:MAG: hypothetical protein K2O03_03540 [Lachnospiraceae bacterium]|nr:hypothetical protein [Lachnospiraceae bacterium]